jgi:hypothetical protein
VFGDHEWLIKNSKPRVWPMRDVRLIKDPRARDKENMMFVFLWLEARQPSATTYRFGFGWFVPPKLASMVVMLIRLF